MSKLRVGFEGYADRAALGKFAPDFNGAYLTLGGFVDFKNK